MPSFRYSTEHKAFTKTCSCCEIVIIGTKDKEESLEIFAKTFSQSNGAGMADGLQSRCWVCNSGKRRSLGVTLEHLRDMHEKQGGCCAICQIPISLDRGANNPANVDHNDNTGKIRELLCGNCNRGIGLFFHNVDILKAAVDYCCRHSEEE